MASTFKSKFNTLSLDGIQPSRDKFNILFNNRSLVLRKDTDSLVQYYGNRNIMLGYDAGNKLRNGDDNLFIGYEAGLHTNNPRIVYTNKEYSSTNIFLGSKAGYNNVHGYSNMYIGYNNSKDLENIISGSVSDEKIYDNISIGSDGSAYGAKTIALGNRTITNDGSNAIVIGHDSSNIGRDSILLGSDILNTGENAFILHSKGNILNDENNYFNINDIFTGISSNIDGNESYMDFNLERLNVHSSLFASNITITESFKSENSSEFKTLTVKDNFFSDGISVCNNTVVIHKPLEVNTKFEISGLLKIDPNTKETKFTKPVSFPNNQTFSNNTIFTGYTTYTSCNNFRTNTITTFEDNSVLTINGSVTIGDVQNFKIGTRPFQDYFQDLTLDGIPLSSLLPSWIKSRQKTINLSGFQNNLAPWLTEDPNQIDLGIFGTTDFFETNFPWLNGKQDAKDIGLEIFNSDNFAPWIHKDPSNIDLSKFNSSNIMKPWVYNKFQREVQLKGFSNDLVPDWALSKQDQVHLSEFNNDIFPDWALNDQSNINLSEFNNDNYKWLDELHDEILVMNEDDNLENASGILKNNIAPWLRHDANDITLTQFYNDITEWNTIVTFTKRVTFLEDTTFMSQVNFRDDIVVSSNIETNGISSTGINELYGSTKIDGDFNTEHIVVNQSTQLNRYVNISGALDVNDIFKVTDSNISFDDNVNFNSNVTFMEYVTFESPIDLNGFSSLGSNYLNGMTKVNGSLESDQILVNQSTQLNKHVNISGKLDVNDIFAITESNVTFRDTVTFTSNVTFMDYVQFESPIHLSQGLTSTGITTINGDFVVGNNVLQVNGNDVIISGNLNLLEGLIDIQDNQYFINTNTTIRSNIQVSYIDSNYVFDVSENGVQVNGNLNVFDSIVVSEDRIDLSSNIYISGNLYVNDMMTVTPSNIIMSGMNIQDNQLKTSIESHFNHNVRINDSDFTIHNEGVDVFKIEGTTVYFNQDTLEAFQKNINLFGRVYGNDDLDIVEVYSDLLCYSNMYVTGSLVVGDKLNIDSDASFSQEVTMDHDVFMKSNLYVYPDDASNSSWWKIYSTPKIDEDTLDYSIMEADLVFKSKNGAVMRFHDTFEESIINFTGQHRCTVYMEEEDDVIGKIVVSTGLYKDLHDNNIIRVNEAIPIVRISNKECDKSVFGVISGIEPDQNTSTFSIGHISFTLNKTITCKKAMINSVGEGGIWVCNINGDLENGDFVCASSVMGLGMRQDTDNRMNYTVAKITCDCTFDMKSPIYKCVEFKNNDQTLRKAFVGCIYCC